MKKTVRWIVDIVLLILLVLVDQWTKYLAVINLKDQAPFVIWDGVFELNYLQNTGAAFGMLKDQKILFVVMSCIVLVLIGYVLIKTPNEKKYTPMHITLVMIAAGAIGNSLLDRLRLDYVVDFFYIKLINFPIFNMADLFVTFGIGILAIYILFVYKEKDLDFLSFNVNKIREIK